MRTKTGDILLALLRAAQHLASLHVREALLRALCVGAQRALGAERCLLHVIRPGAQGLQLAGLGWCSADDEGGVWEDVSDDAPLLPGDPFLLGVLSGGDVAHRVRVGEGWRMAFPVMHGGRKRWVFEVCLRRPVSTAVIDGIHAYIRCFERLMAQWEYANLDTLTGLLNRKTFDEQFDQLIASAEQVRRSDDDRRDDSNGPNPSWLGIVDIDHFKHINDTWGHLFGDEVLIRLAERMRQAFRGSDKLFRFGGEEFVVMLRNIPEDTVSAIFERFRRDIEAHDFPQVGTVTCSLGYTRVDNSEAPAALLGRADTALYYAKEHGRNCTWNYEMLLAIGEVSAIVTPGNAQEDADQYF